MRSYAPRTSGAGPVTGGLPGEALARFAERCGLPVLETLGALWMRRSRFLFQSLPPQRELALAPREVEAALQRHRAVALQYPVPLDPGEQESTGLFVCRTQGFTLERLTKRRRARVRQGQACSELRRMDPDELHAQGFALNLETMARQRRFAPELGIPARWERFCAAVRDTPEVRAYGAFVNGRLATYSLTCQDGTWLHGIVKMQRTDSLCHNTSSALDAWVLGEVARDPGIEVLVNGLARGPGDPLSDYKRSFGFEVLPQRRVTRLHPALRALARSGLPTALAAGVPRLRGLAQWAAEAAAADVPGPGDGAREPAPQSPQGGGP